MEKQNLRSAAVLIIAALGVAGCQAPAPGLTDLAVRLNDQVAAEPPHHPDKALKLLAEAQAAFPACRRCTTTSASPTSKGLLLGGSRGLPAGFGGRSADLQPL